jgi:hypothetical protein
MGWGGSWACTSYTIAPFKWSDCHTWFLSTLTWFLMCRLPATVLAAAHCFARAVNTLFEVGGRGCCGCKGRAGAVACMACTQRLRRDPVDSPCMPGPATSTHNCCCRPSKCKEWAQGQGPGQEFACAPEEFTFLCLSFSSKARGRVRNSLVAPGFQLRVSRPGIGLTCVPGSSQSKVFGTCCYSQELLQACGCAGQGTPAHTRCRRLGNRGVHAEARRCLPGMRC